MAREITGGSRHPLRTAPVRRSGTEPVRRSGTEPVRLGIASRPVAFAELLAHPAVVEALELRSPVGFLALHGGLEPGTGELVDAAASRSGASSYVVQQPHDLKHHVPSVLADPADAPRLAAFLDHVDVVISVHGYWSRREELGHAILVGGAHRGLVDTMAGRLRQALPDVAVVDDPDAIPPDLRGLDPRNPVNLVPGGGVQLELPPRVRVIGRVAERPEARAYVARTEVLVEALASFARDLPGTEPFRRSGTEPFRRSGTEPA